MSIKIAEKKVEALLLDQDIKSGKLAFDLGMARVAVAASEAVSEGAVQGAIQAKGGHGAKSGVGSQTAESGVANFEIQSQFAIAAEDALKQVSGDGNGGAFGFGTGAAIGSGSGGFPILPHEDDLEPEKR